MLTLSHVIEGLTGYQSAGGPQVITDAVIDSRRAIPGSLFVALPGERVDGHDFVAQAFARGAVAALVQRDLELECATLDLRRPLTYEQAAGLGLPVCLRVNNTLAALQTLGAFWRQQLSLRVIGITGSVGKTTSKELIAAVLSTRFRTLKTEGNLNNEIGLPLMLLQLTEQHERAVLEMGFYQVGEIAQLCQWARPHVGVINNVYAVHLERAGSLENIIQGKGELVEALPPDGTAILNLDDPRVMTMRTRTRAAIFTYGLDPNADLWADEIESRGLAGCYFRFHHRGEVLREEPAKLVKFTASQGRPLYGAMLETTFYMTEEVARLPFLRLISVVLLAVLALVVVRALAESAWGVFTVGATIPIAMFMGGYMRFWRVGKVGEASALGVISLLLFHRRFLRTGRSSKQELPMATAETPMQESPEEKL